MSILILAITFIIALIIGVFIGYSLIVYAIKHDAENKTGVWLSYSEKNDQWDCYGDLVVTFSKARSHHKPINYRFQ